MDNAWMWAWALTMFWHIISCFAGRYLVREHEKQRAEWARERAALLERCVPGLTLTDAVDERPTPAYGTDAYEWEVDRQRRGAQTDDVI